MARPTLALTMIVKNESVHAKRLVKELSGLFDQYVIVDTGSTDDTKEIFQAAGWEVYDFKWADDFSAARNETLKYVKTDYFLWLDSDDSLHNVDGFLNLRDNLSGADVWFANYEYALNEKGESVCTFTRERIIKTSLGAKWHFFCHEGVFPPPNAKPQWTPAFSIKHLRSEDDAKADRGRNLRLFELRKPEELDARMTYYYGKELFEAGRKDEALVQLLRANQMPGLEVHDRLLSLQYSCYVLHEKGDFVKAIDLAGSGLILDPTRAEFFVLMGDSYVRMNKYREALPYYFAAQGCLQTNSPTFIYSAKDAYGPYPRNAISRIFFHLQLFDEALAFSKQTVQKFPEDHESKVLLDEIQKQVQKTFSFKGAEACEDIVFTVPMAVYEFDELIEKTRGVGGSEIALIEMAKHMHQISKRKVIVFTPRLGETVMPSGVIYRPAADMQEYFATHKPALHIAWRHNLKITDAKTLLWSHDLITPNGNLVSYDKYLCLSEFHSGFVQSMLGVPADKIAVVGNGIRPELFKKIDLSKKNPNKVVFCSSPDRGLIQAINVMEAARVYLPNLELHCFYGLDNLRKGGMNELADSIQKEIDSRHWVHMHGNLKQADLLAHYESAVAWLYSTVFQESFCISALETACSGVYPIVRKYGALPETLKPFIDNGQASCLDEDPNTMGGVVAFADELKRVISEHRWEKLKGADPNDYSWAKEAALWLEKFI